MGKETLLSIQNRAAGFRPLGVFLPLLLAAGACAPATTPAPSPPASPAATAELVLLATTDVHNRLYPYDYYTGTPTDHGLALLKPVIDSIRAAHPARAWLFDSGDLLQGSPLGYVYARQYADRANPVIRAMDLLRYDATAVGNHEYNYGIGYLDRAIKQAAFPFLSANVFLAGTDRHAYRAWVLLPYVAGSGDTIQIGVTGTTPPGVAVWDKGNVEGRLEFRDAVPAVRDAVRELRGAGADLVVVLAHSGLDGTSYDTIATRLPAENVAARMAREVPGIDVIFMGHTHRQVADTTINGVLLVQPREWARQLAAVTVRLERRAPSEWHAVNRSARLIAAAGHQPDRAFMDSLRWEHERTVEYVSARIGRATAAMSARDARVHDTPIIDFINEVQRKHAGAELAASAAFRLDARLPAGEISVADVAALYPYDNTLKAIRISGGQLRAYLEKSAEYYAAPGSATITDRRVPGYNFDIISGVDYTLDISRPIGQRVTRLERNGRAVAPGDSFTLALNNYRQSGGGGYAMIAAAPVVYDRQEDIRELLIDEIRSRGTVNPSDYSVRNWELQPGALAERALSEQAGAEVPTSLAPTPRARLRVLTTNDFHGRLQAEKPSWAGGREVGGAAVLGGYFARERAGFGGGPVLLLDGGDIMQGTPISNLTGGRSTIEYYNTVGYGAAAIGNHEYDWGQQVLRERVAQAKYPWLSANTVVAGTDTTPSWIKPTALLNVGGLRVALIGLTSQETPSATKAENVRGLAFLDGAATLDRYVPRLRQQADFVIAIAHAGGECDRETLNCRDEIVDWARRTHAKPDLIVAAHTHQVMRTVENGIAIVEAGSYGTRYGVIDLERVRDDSVDAWIRGTPSTFADVVQPDSAIAALVARYAREIGPRVDQVIATAAQEIRRGSGETPMGRLIADAQKHATGAQISIMNNGGVRANIDAGPITWGELYQVHPFGNQLIKLAMTGAQVKEALEHAVRGAQPAAQVSGLVAWYDTASPPGSRIVKVQLEDGTALQPDAVYTVVTNDFLAGEGDGFGVFAHAARRENTGILDLDALIEYVRSFSGPIVAPQNQRLRPAAPGSDKKSAGS